MGVVYEKKTVFHIFGEALIKFVFRRLKLVCECWEKGKKMQPRWVNRSEVMCHTGYALRLKWNLDPADPTENVSPGYGLDWGKRSTLFLWIVFFYGFIIFDFWFHFMYILDGGLQKHQVIVTSLGCCCRHSGGVSQSPDCWSSCYVWGKMKASEVGDDRGMVSDAEGVWDLVGKMVSCLSDRISVCVVVVLMAVVAVAVLMVVLGVVCFGAVVVFYGGKRHLCVGWDFVVVVEVKLVMRWLVKLVLWCLSGREDFFVMF